MKVLRIIIAIPITILFIPIAIILCFGVAILLLPEMLIDCFEEISGKIKNKQER